MYNGPSNELFSVCTAVPEGQHCIRNFVAKAHFSSYDNCPAPHACEKLPFIEGSSLDVWVEGGAILGSNGKWRLWTMDPNAENYQNRIYPCLRCLSHANYSGVKTMANLVKKDDKWSVDYHDVEAHASMLMILATENAMKE
jgi:hypothetical protein